MEQKDTADSAEEFQKRWKAHIDELEKLKQSLPVGKWDELDDHIDSLHKLVDSATVEE